MKLRSVLPVALAVSALSFAAAQHPVAPAPSTWQLNIAASDFGDLPQPTSITTTLLANSETSVSWRHVVTDSHGTITGTWSGARDGKLRPVSGVDGEMFSITRDGTFHVDASDGTTVDGTIIAADDLKSLTETDTVKTPDGHEHHQKLIFDRVK